jgi:phage-related protein
MKKEGRNLSSMGLQYLDELSVEDRDRNIERLMDLARASDKEFKLQISNARNHEEDLRKAEHARVMQGLLEKSNQARELARIKRAKNKTTSIH